MTLEENTLRGLAGAGALPQLTCPEDEHPQAWSPDVVTKQLSPVNAQACFSRIINDTTLSTQHMD